jgi:hypothetical protein
MIRAFVDRTSAVACLVILLGFVYAGLSPFHAPRNGARWLSKENGIRILGDGVLLSDQLFYFDGPAKSGCSIEVWLQSAYNQETSTVLDFYQHDPLRQLVIQQNGNSKLQLLKSELSGLRMMEFEHTFFPGKRTLITVTSGSWGTTLYLDATAVLSSDSFALSGRECSGKLILGAAAISHNNWNGDLLGIAIYNGNLTSSQVLRDYEAWNTPGQFKLSSTESVAALYTFRERHGSIVHNEVSGKPDLYIPANFQIPNRPFLENPGAEFRSIGFDWRDLFMNILGFVPFGFFCFSFLHSSRTKIKAGFAAILLGALISLTIEVLQWYLPTRNSSMTDVLTNSFGTVLGVIVYRLLLWTDSPMKPVTH